VRSGRDRPRTGVGAQKRRNLRGAGLIDVELGRAQGWIGGFEFVFDLLQVKEVCAKASEGIRPAKRISKMPGPTAAKARTAASRHKVLDTSSGCLGASSS